MFSIFTQSFFGSSGHTKRSAPRSSIKTEKVWKSGTFKNAKIIISPTHMHGKFWLRRKKIFFVVNSFFIWNKRGRNLVAFVANKKIWNAFDDHFFNSLVNKLSSFTSKLRE